MNALEKRTTLIVALIFFCRMMGLFMLLPIISVYGMNLQGANLSLLGIAVGVYGLSQAVLQIPFSMLSDRYGRKNIILIGLFIFFIGSLASLFVESVWALIICRAVQGAGAIAGTSMVLLADNSRVEYRTKVMAVVGVSIGASFVLALVLGPLIASLFGLKGVFIAATLLAGLALIVCFFGLDESSYPATDIAIEKTTGIQLEKFVLIIRDSALMSFACSVFVLHLVMTASFIVIPIILESSHHINRELHWQVYLIVFAVSLLLMGPFMRFSQDVEKTKALFFSANVLLVIVLVSLAFLYDSYWPALALFALYFLSFNLLEALLPSLMSQSVDEERKATAMGVFSSFQFMGAFTGGILSGFVAEFGSIELVFILCAGFVVGALLLSLIYYGRPTSFTSI